MLLDEFLPEYDFGEVHSTRVAAPPEGVLEAVRSVTLGAMPLVRLLFAVRSLPALVAGERGLPTGTAEPLYEQMLDFGFVLLAEEPGRELIFGGIGQMFRVSGGSRPAVRDADGFRDFGEPGYAKVAMNFSVEARAGGAELRTETRVLATDAISRRRFGRYWRLIRPGSALVRRRWLRAAKRRAEPAGPGARAASAGGVSRAAPVSLAGVFAGAGLAKVALPKDCLRAPMPWVDDFSQGTVRLIGALELFGAAGVALPRATGALSPLAAAGLAAIMVGGFATHVRRREFLRSASNVVLFALAAAVARCRSSSS